MSVFGNDVRVSRSATRAREPRSAAPASSAAPRASAAGAVRIAFDSRPAAKEHGVGHYARCLLAALRDTAAEDVEIVETHRPYAARSRVELFHAPWLDGAALRSPCPMVVTLHDLDMLTRRSERLRRGGVHMRLRHLALQRAARVIVHSEAMAEEASSKLGLERERVVVIPRAPAWSWQDIARATWEVYERALSEPPRPFISRPRAASRRRGGLDQ